MGSKKESTKKTLSKLELNYFMETLLDKISNVIAKLESSPTTLFFSTDGESGIFGT
jgi:hypothetical protein